MAEGWFIDSYGIHEQRWVSAGRPSSLVRDGGNEAKDEPPDRPATLPFVTAPVDESLGDRDLLRADDADNQPIPPSDIYGEVATDANVVFDSSVIGGPAPSGDRTGAMFESPLQRKMRQRARKKRWAGRWHRIFEPKS